MPYRHSVVIHVFVYGQIWRLVNFSWLQNQHLQKRFNIFFTNIYFTFFKFSCHYSGILFVAHRKANGGDIFFSCLHQEVHPKVEQLLFWCWRLCAGLFKVLVDQDGLHQWVQIPEDIQVKKKLNIQD